jgi:G3E family GTPase
MRAMNAEARILTVVRGEIAPALLFASPRASPSSPAFLAHGEGRSGLSLTPDLTSPALFPLGERRPGLPDLPGREVGGEGKPSAGDHIAHPHTPDITTYCLVRDQPVHAATLALFVSALAENCGEDLLRTKGLVSVAESPGKPAVIHGVQHVYHAPEWLRRWPSADERTRMVFIGRRLRPAWLEALLDLLEAEVAAATAARGSAA